MRRSSSALDRQRHLDGHRRHELEQQSGDCGIDVNRGHALAGKLGVQEPDRRRHSAAVHGCHIGRIGLPHRPPRITRPCNSAGSPSSRRTKRAWSTEALRVAPQLFLDGLEFSPRDISLRSDPGMTACAHSSGPSLRRSIWPFGACRQRSDHRHKRQRKPGWSARCEPGCSYSAHQIIVPACSPPQTNLCKSYSRSE